MQLQETEIHESRTIVQSDEYQAYSSRVLQLPNSAEILPRVASEKEQEAASEKTLNISDEAKTL